MQALQEQALARGRGNVHGAAAFRVQRARQLGGQQRVLRQDRPHAGGVTVVLHRGHPAAPVLVGGQRELGGSVHGQGGGQQGGHDHRTHRPERDVAAPRRRRRRRRGFTRVVPPHRKVERRPPVDTLQRGCPVVPRQQRQHRLVGRAVQNGLVDRVRGQLLLQRRGHGLQVCGRVRLQMRGEHRRDL